MSIYQTAVSTFKDELLRGVHNFASGGSTFKIALYSSTANLDSATVSYTGTTGEVPNGSGYITGGKVLTGQSITTSGTVSFIDFDSVSWVGASFSAAGALIYNDSAVGKPAVLVLNFGGTYLSTNSTFTVSFPNATSTTALLILN